MSTISYAITMCEDQHPFHLVHLVHIPCTIIINTLYIVTDLIDIDTKYEHRHLFIFIKKNE